MNILFIKNNFIWAMVFLVVSCSACGAQDIVFDNATFLKLDYKQDLSDEAWARELQSYTPLHYAAFKGDVALVAKFVQEEADVNVSSHYEVTPLHLAARHSPAIVDLLIKSGAIPAYSLGLRGFPLRVAARFGNLKTFKLLTQVLPVEFNDIIPCVPLNLRFKFAAHASLMQERILKLEEAVAKHDPVMAQKVIGAGVILVRNDEYAPHNTLLHKVIGAYDPKEPTNSDNIAKLIVHKLGRQIRRMRNAQEQTPLHIAAMQGNIRLMRLFLRYGADVNAQDKDGNTPSHYAMGPAALKVLLDHNPLFLIRNNEGDIAIKSIVAFAQFWEKDGQSA